MRILVLKTMQRQFFVVLVKKDSQQCNVVQRQSVVQCQSRDNKQYSISIMSMSIQSAVWCHYRKTVSRQQIVRVEIITCILSVQEKSVVQCQYSDNQQYSVSVESQSLVQCQCKKIQQYSVSVETASITVVKKRQSISTRTQYLTYCR